MVASVTELQTAFDCVILRTRPEAPDDARALSRRVQAGELRRVTVGRFVASAWWDEASPEQRHVVIARAVSGRLPDGAVFSHQTAAVLDRIPLLADPPPRVQFVRFGLTRSGSARYAVQRADLSPELSETVRPFDRLRATGPLRTAVDLATSVPYDDAVVALDHVLAHGVAREDLDREILRRGIHGRARALRALDFADPLSGSPGESLLRLRMQELGAPPPVLQFRFREPDAPDAIVDFWFPEQGVVVEFDGAAKYLDSSLRGSRTAGQVVHAEKLREDRLRARPEVRTVIRIVWADLFDLPKLARKLRAAGVPLLWA